MVKLKCVECNEDAVYVFEGYSVCLKHIDELKLKVANMKQQMGAVFQKSMERLNELRGGN